MSNNFSTNYGKIFADATTLDKAKLNTEYVITCCNLPDNIKTRFSELGFVSGSKITVIKKAPLGDPIEITICGYSLCVRASEAKHIAVARQL